MLGDVAEQTPRNTLHDRVVEEVAELASKEVPNRETSASASNDSVFFLQTGDDGSMMLWVGAGSGVANLKAIQANQDSSRHSDGPARSRLLSSLSRRCNADRRRKLYLSGTFGAG